KREDTPDLDCQLVRQCGSTCRPLRPHPLRVGDAPPCGRGARQMMLPGPILLGLEFVPAPLRLGILKGALGAVAAATPRAQTGLGGAGGAWSSVSGQAPARLRRLTKHAMRGLPPATPGPAP